MMTVAWFSAGGSSAVAIKLMADKIDRIIYIHIPDQHPDTLRYVADCAVWFGKPIEILYAPCNVETSCYSAGGRGYINGPSGAACTRLLKRMVRQQWEYELPPGTELRYVWGMDADETDRLDNPETGLRVKMPDKEHVCPLIDCGLSKEQVHPILYASGVKRPAMYDMGYLNNNCVGCVKGGMAYWNKIRVDFPEVFAARAAMERKIRATCIKGVYLDELDPKRGRGSKPLVSDCGVMCELLDLTGVV